MDTALLSFALLELPIVVLPQLQSLHSENSGIGLDQDQLKKKYKEVTRLGALDLSHLEDGWNSKEGKFHPQQSALIMNEMKLWHRGAFDSQSEPGIQREVVGVGHRSWIKYFLEREVRHSIP